MAARIHQSDGIDKDREGELVSDLAMRLEPSSLEALSVPDGLTANQGVIAAARRVSAPVTERI